ncbi:MAG: hypothetical protein ABGW91_10180 [Christiangramia sp.]
MRIEKIIFLLLNLLLLISCRQQTEKTRQADRNSEEVTSEISARATTPPKDLATIKTRFSEIETVRKTGKLDTISFTYNCYNERSGKVTFYSEKEKLVLIEHRYNEYSHHEATDWFYLYNKEPFFVFLDRLDWSFDGQSGGETQTRDQITQSRLYFLNGKALQCLEKNFERTSNAGSVETEIPNTETDCSKASEALSEFQKLWNSRNSNSSEVFCNTA